MIEKVNDIFITVNICCYNSSKFLEETIKSVLAQTYLNFELLIIDDGSTDDTKIIVKKFMKKNQNIRYYYQQNNGYPSARNLAINLAKGEWIAIIDHDDIMLPNRLKEQVSDILINPSAKLFSSDSNHMDSYGNFTNNSFSKFNPSNLNLNLRIAAFELIKKHDKEIPEALDYFLEVANLGETEFYDLIKKMKVEGVEGIELPTSYRKSPLEETKRKPFVQQLIDELRPPIISKINK